MEEPYNRTINERKRKFVDTELAQDTEGNRTFMHCDLDTLLLCYLGAFKACLFFCGNIIYFLFFFFLRFFSFVLAVQYVVFRLSSLCVSATELFQDLSQLQEIWIAEGEGSCLIVRFQ